MKKAILLILAAVLLAHAYAADEKPAVGFEIQFGGEAQKESKANYEVEIEFYGGDDGFDYINAFGIQPYSPVLACKALNTVLNRDKIETVKSGDNGIIITGYRGPDKKLHPVKSVKITPKGETTLEKVPTIKDTRLKS
jgi:hypothetical protein